MHKVFIPKGHPSKGRILLRTQIEDAQKHTVSNAAAARYLGVDKDTYKKYASLYGLYHSHSNQRGVGVDKGWSKKPTSIPLTEILAGKHPTYNLQKLKNRLLARNRIARHCELCKFYEERITDKKAPLLLTMRQTSLENNYALDNLQLLCYNCFFLTTGAPSIAHATQGTLHKSFQQTYLSAHQEILSTPTHADYHDPHDDLLYTDIRLTPEEQAALLNSIS